MVLTLLLFSVANKFIADHYFSKLCFLLLLLFLLCINSSLVTSTRKNQGEIPGEIKTLTPNLILTSLHRFRKRNQWAVRINEVIGTNLFKRGRKEKQKKWKMIYDKKIIAEERIWQYWYEMKMDVERGEERKSIRKREKWNAKQR